MDTFEIEIKSLLGAGENADAFRKKLLARDDCVLEGKNNQLNHYFEGGDVKQLATKVTEHLDAEAQQKLKNIIEKGSDFSVRTRDKDGSVLLVVKASVDEGTSANTVSRLEFEEAVDLTIDDLDQLLLDAGYQYQAKWSREREEYKLGDTNITLDRNAGYGYLTEFERVVTDKSQIDDARAEIENLMQEFDVVELPQDRLARMFDHYNQNWRDYYGTDKVFTIE